MAHGFLQSFDKDLIICLAGTKVVGKFNKLVFRTMLEVDIDIYHHTFDPIKKHLNEVWDYVITFCRGVNEACPAFKGNVKHYLHIGFDDLLHVEDTSEFIESEFRRMRDEIKVKFAEFLSKRLKKKLPECSGSGNC